MRIKKSRKIFIKLDMTKDSPNHVSDGNPWYRWMISHHFYPNRSPFSTTANIEAISLEFFNIFNINLWFLCFLNNYNFIFY